VDVLQAVAAEGSKQDVGGPAFVGGAGEAAVAAITEFCQ
jgi:hypothetical protein